MKKILGYGLLVGVLMIVVNSLLNLIFGWIFPSFNAIYQNTEIFKAMNDPMMFLFWLYPIVLGIAFAWVWNKSKRSFKAKSACIKGLHFSLIYLAIAAIPAFFINAGSFNLPTMMVFTWTIQSFANGWVAGWALARLNK
jgi:hypothetical protein